MKLLRVIDTETTGLPPMMDAVQVGYTDVLIDDDGKINISIPFEFLCKPIMPISLGAMAIHHIRERDVANARPSKEVLAQVASPNVYAYVAHKADFDRRLFNPPGKAWIDTMRCGRKVWPQSPAFSNQVLRYFLEIDDEPDFEETHARPPHAAGPDSYITAFIVRRLLMVHQPIELIKWSSSAMILAQLPFGKHKGIPASSVPTEYYQWILRQEQAEPDVRATATHYLTERGAM